FSLLHIRKFDLSDSQDLIEVPDLCKAEKLESVNVNYCESLHQLHPSMLSLPKLMHLYLSGCKEIESTIVHSKSLCVLELYRCSSLKEFSVMSEEMTELNLAYTPICALPLLGAKLSSDPDLFGYTQHNALFVQALHHNIGHLLSLEVLDLCGTNVESLPANIKSLPMLRQLKLDDCMKLVSLPELPPSLEQLWARNCTSLDTDFTQWLVLQHMFQSRIPYTNILLHDEEYFSFPGDHITNKGGFCAAERSITIPYLPQSDLHAFIYCFILSKGSSSNAWASYSIYQDGRDHMLFLYHNVCQFYTMSEMYDHLSNIPFKFEFNYCISMDEHDQVRIKGCGIFPVYATASGWKLVSGSSKEIFESESITQIFDNELLPRSIGIGARGSNDENDDDREQLPPTKRGRTST
ncbi:Disease resistance protein RML1B, partial [Mucuna pruriens]